MADSGRLSAQDFDNLDSHINITQPSQGLNSSASNGSFGNSALGSLGNAVIGAGNIVGNAAHGFGDALSNTAASTLNMLPGINLPQTQTGQGTGYGLGKVAGNVAGFVGGGELADTARMLGEGLPIAGKAFGYLGGSGIAPGIARRALGNAAYGAAANNQDRGQSAGLGAGMSLASEAIPGIAGKVAQAAQYFMPQRYAQGIIQGLSGGQSLSDATKSVLGSVKNAYDSQVENAKNAYSPVLDSVGNSSIYAPVKSVYGIPSVAPTNTAVVSRAYTPVDQGVNPAFEEPTGKNISSSIVAKGTQNPASFLEGAYPNLSQNITDNYTSALKDMHNEFINNPTFQNAHNLQSELGTVSRQLTAGNTAPTISTLDNAKAINNARGALKLDMSEFLTGVDPKLNDEYNAASDNFLQNVVPYRVNPKIYSIATGDVTNVAPNSLAGIFKAPDQNMQKILGDLPQGTMDKILFTKLGQTVPNKSAQGLINTSQNLEQQGLGEYVSPELKQNLGELENRIKARSALQMGSSTAAGAALGSIGGPIMAGGGAALGLGAGAVINPFMNYMSRRWPVDETTQAISNVLRGSYPAVKNTVISNYLNNSGVQNGS